MSENTCPALCQVLCIKEEKGLLLPFMLLIIEDSGENAFPTISITKKTHTSCSSPDLPKGSPNEIRSTNHPAQRLLSRLKVSDTTNVECYKIHLIGR